jgi:biopolymer transport protein ExbD
LASWDVFHADRLELERGLSTQAIREALLRGSLRDDDLVRPAGTTAAWGPLADIPELMPAPQQTPQSAPPAQASVQSPPAPAIPGAAPTSDFEVEAEDADGAPPTPAPTLRAPDWFHLRSETDDVAFPVLKDQPEKPVPPEIPAPATAPPWVWAEQGADEDEDEDENEGGGEDDEAGEVGLGEEAEVLDAIPDDDDLEVLEDDRELVLPGVAAKGSETESQTSRVALPVVAARGWDDTRTDVEDEEEEADLSLSRRGPQTVEELDLAPMVDVAFQLVLFFMVTATTVLFKTLEIPKPSSEAPPSAVAQGRSRSLDDLQSDYILVEVDPAGAMKIDREPVAAEMSTLVERLRQAREKTHRKAMLLLADYETKHRNSVLAYDAAFEIGLGIVVARPKAPPGPPPALVPSAPQKAANAAAAATVPGAPGLN